MRPDIPVYGVLNSVVESLLKGFFELSSWNGAPGGHFEGLTLMDGDCDEVFTDRLDAKVSMFPITACQQLT